MATVKVCDGIEIVNADISALKELRRTSNSLEEGADLILEALVDFADCQLEAHKNDKDLSYKKLFFALKLIIDSACSNKNTRDALLVGLIMNKGFEFKETESNEEKEEKEPSMISIRNKAAIAKYAKNHTAREVQKHFRFPTVTAAKQYMRSYGLEFVKGERGRPSVDLDYVRVSELAKTMRLCELSRAFCVSREQMMYFCIKNKIQYVRITRNKK